MKKVLIALSSVALMLGAITAHASDMDLGFSIFSPAEIDLTYAEPAPPDKLLSDTLYILTDISATLPSGDPNFSEDVERHHIMAFADTTKKPQALVPTFAPFEVGWRFS